MQRRPNDPGSVRRKIVLAAFERFAREGYHATPMHAVRDLAQVSSGALAHHFPTKLELGLAVIRGPVADAITETWIRPVECADDAIEGVQSVFGATIADIDRAGTTTGCPLGNLTAELSAQNEAFRSELDQVFDEWKNAIAAKLRAASSMDIEDSQTLSGVIVACFSGAILMAKASQSSLPLRQCKAQVRQLLEVHAADGG